MADGCALAATDLDDVLHAWQGLGYYARARNLHRCANVVSESYGGQFPEEEDALLSLPGVGTYTAAAIRAIAFDKRAVVVDGNVERVMARLYRETDPLPGVKGKLRDRADKLTPNARPGDYAQAVMDLGATVCIPRRPKCMLCPWTAHCRGKDIAESLPARRPKPEKPTRHGTIFWIERLDGSVLVRRRPEKGLLGGMMEFRRPIGAKAPVRATSLPSPTTPPSPPWNGIPSRASFGTPSPISDWSLTF